jgi:aminomethyltransferase
LTFEAFLPELLETPFHSQLSPLNRANDWHAWHDYTVATSYADPLQEYFAIRNTCSIFDLSPMSKYRISGPDAEACLNRLLTRDVTKVKPGRVTYSVWCNDHGRVIDDGTLFRLGEEDFMLCSQERHMEWLMMTANGFDVSITEATAEIAALSLQGPTSCATLQAMGIEGIENLKPFGLQTFAHGGMDIMISRTGFTGDLGYELWVPPDNAERLMIGLLKAGKLLGIMPIGSEALDRARIEAGFIQAGVDFVPANQAVRPGFDRSPFELGLEWLVDLSKPHFNGKRALVREKKKGSKHRFVKLDIEGNKVAHQAYIYYGKGQVIGSVTSSTWSPTLKSNIALATVNAAYGRPGDKLWAEIYYQRELKWHTTWARAHVVEGAFYEPPRRRQTPPAPF